MRSQPSVPNTATTNASAKLGYMKDNSYWISARYKTIGLRVYQLLQDKVFDV